MYHSIILASFPGSPPCEQNTCRGEEPGNEAIILWMSPFEDRTFNDGWVGRGDWPTKHTIPGLQGQASGMQYKQGLGSGYIYK